MYQKGCKKAPFLLLSQVIKGNVPKIKILEQNVPKCTKICTKIFKNDPKKQKNDPKKAKKIHQIFGVSFDIFYFLRYLITVCLPMPKVSAIAC